MSTRADWTHLFSHRAGERGGEELAAILAGVPEGVLPLTGGFPNASTFPTDVLGEIAARVLRDEPGRALQYTPVEGIASVREYLADRQEALQGVRPERLMVTSGGMECLALVCSALLDPGDAIAVEGPTYLGALMAFRAAEAAVHEIPMDDDGLVVDALAERLEGGLRPKLLYVIPEHQNPTGRTLPLERREALVELCRRHGVLIVEDVAYRELAWRAETPDGVTWTEPTGGFLTWVQLPEGLDATELREAALAAGVAYVPGAPFYASAAGAGELRLSFSALDEADLAEAGRRLAAAIR